MDVRRVRSLSGAIGVAFTLVAPPAAAASLSGGVSSPAAGSSVASAGGCGGEVLPPSPEGGQWTCSFDDEFDATTGDPSSLNRSSWTPVLTATTGFVSGTSSAWTCYVDSPENISVSDGALHLTVRKEPAPVQCGSLTTQYTSGMVTTGSTFDQTYGRFEVRALLPQTLLPGLQETLWLYPQNLTYGPWPASGEVDFAEFYSLYSLLDVPYIHYHYDATSTNPLTDTNVTTADCPIVATQYNDYAVVWEPGSFTITINGNTCLVDRYQANGGLPPTAPFDQPFFIALTQGLGIGANAYDPLLTSLPATTSIDYVRAWTASAGAGQGSATGSTSGTGSTGSAGTSRSQPRPVLSALRVSPGTFTLAGRQVRGRCVKPTRGNRRHRRCTRPIRFRIGYQLNTPASVTLTIARQLTGRVVNRHCVTTTRKNRSHRSCTRLLAPRAPLTTKGTQGANSLIFSGRIGAHRLTPGHYRLTVTPTADGQTGTPRTSTFTITS